MAWGLSFANDQNTSTLHPEYINLTSNTTSKIRLKT